MNLQLILLASFHNFLKKLKICLAVRGVHGRWKIKDRNKFKILSAETNTKQSIEKKTAKGNAVWRNCPNSD